MFKWVVWSGRALTVALGAAALVPSSGCNGDGADEVSAAQGGAGQGGPVGGDGGSSTSGAQDTSISVTSGSGGNPPCAQSSLEATVEKKPVDIILAVGNNGSLAQEIAAVEANINVNFAQIIENSGIDYRVILLSRSGAHQFNICVEAPLGVVPAGGCATQPNDAPPLQNPPKFFHYSTTIWNDDSWCKLLATFNGDLPDEYGQQPDGWQAWLRPEAAKTFVLLSDSHINCSHQGIDFGDGPQQPNTSNIPLAQEAAAKFEDALFALSPTQFGTSGARNYTWHSIVGLEPKSPQNPADAWLPSDALSLVKCTVGASPVSPGIGYQSLSIMTGGLRFPICEWNDFDTVFTTIAQGIVTGAPLACELDIPDPPAGETIDLTTLEVEYTPTGAMPRTFQQVANASECVQDAFYLEADRIVLCPDTCATVQGDASAKIGILYGCEVTAD